MNHLHSGKTITTTSPTDARPGATRPASTPVFPEPRTAAPFELLESCLPVRRHSLREGAAAYRAGDRFTDLHLVRSGVFKVMVVTRDGREKVLALRLKGDWLGFDGIADGHYACDAIAIEPGEVWSVRYDALLEASVDRPELAALIHRAMGHEIAGDRDSMMALYTLPADARVARFLGGWLESLSHRGMQTDRITLRLTRAEIGNHLGMTLETVSRAFSRLVRENVIRFVEGHHREVQVPDVDRLRRFVQSSLMPTTIH
ncbi:MAG TPA: Crp/Fnr family transcriptional regulator [Albitalea sp.]